MFTVSIVRQYLMTQVGHNKGKFSDAFISNSCCDKVFLLAVDLSSIFPLKSSCELQIQYLDAALSEAKKCRESLLLFVQV